MLDGVDAAYVSYYPDLAFPGAAESIRAFAERAAAAGVQRLVLLSGRGEEEAEISERGVTESGVDWTVLRCNWFAQDFSEHFLLPPVLDGVIALPTDVPEPFVDLEDVADVAVAALTGDGHAGRIYVLSGPRPVTFSEAAADIAAASGRPVRFERVTARGVHATAGDVGYGPGGGGGADRPVRPRPGRAQRRRSATTSSG